MPKVGKALRYESFTSGKASNLSHDNKSYFIHFIVLTAMDLLFYLTAFINMFLISYVYFIHLFTAMNLSFVLHKFSNLHDFLV